MTEKADCILLCLEMFWRKASNYVSVKPKEMTSSFCLGLCTCSCVYKVAPGCRNIYTQKYHKKINGQQCAPTCTHSDSKRHSNKNFNTFYEDGIR